MTRLRPKTLATSGLLLALVIVAFFLWKPALIHYHLSGMRAADEAIHRLGPKPGQSKYIIAFQKHRSALVELGYLEYREMMVQHSNMDAPERRQLYLALNSATTNSDSFFIMRQNGFATQVELWARPGEMPKLKTVIEGFSTTNKETSSSSGH